MKQKVSDGVIYVRVSVLLKAENLLAHIITILGAKPLTNSPSCTV